MLQLGPQDNAVDYMRAIFAPAISSIFPVSRTWDAQGPCAAAAGFCGDVRIICQALNFEADKLVSYSCGNVTSFDI